MQLIFILTAFPPVVMTLSDVSQSSVFLFPVLYMKNLPDLTYAVSKTFKTMLMLLMLKLIVIDSTSKWLCGQRKIKHVLRPHIRIEDRPKGHFPSQLCGFLLSFT